MDLKIVSLNELINVLCEDNGLDDFNIICSSVFTNKWNNILKDYSYIYYTIENLELWKIISILDYNKESSVKRFNILNRNEQEVILNNFMKTKKYPNNLNKLVNELNINLIIINNDINIELYNIDNNDNYFIILKDKENYYPLFNDLNNPVFNNYDNLIISILNMDILEYKNKSLKNDNKELVENIKNTKLYKLKIKELKDVATKLGIMTYNIINNKMKSKKKEYLYKEIINYK
jgi:hypothetical protein